jgi:uncharacterized protein YciI
LLCNNPCKDGNDAAKGRERIHMACNYSSASCSDMRTSCDNIPTAGDNFCKAVQPVFLNRIPLNTQSGERMKIVCFYDMAADALSKVAAHFPAHRGRLDEFHARGVLVAAGPLGNPPEGAMAIFTTREAAEEFVKADPFVVHGLVSQWRLVEWKAAFI